MKKRNGVGDRGSLRAQQELPGSKIPAEGVDGRCCRATGRNRVKDNRKGRPGLSFWREMTMERWPSGAPKRGVANRS